MPRPFTATLFGTMTASLALAAVVSVAAPASAGVAVRLDGSTRVALPRPARDIVVGNPSIADVQLLSDRSLVVIGKAYGSTTVLVVDRGGNTILDEAIVVTPADGDHVSYIRGGVLQNFSCSPRCERTPQTGEVESAFGPWNTTVTGYSDRAKSSGATSNGGGGAPTTQPVQ